MYAVIRTGGKQYRVAQNDLLRIERLNGAEAGGTVEFDVLAVGDGDDLKVGSPLVDGAKVTATVVGQRHKGPDGQWVAETTDDGETVLDDEGNPVPAKFAWGQGRKVLVYKYKRRKNYRRKRGHRQHFTEIRITGIEA